MSKSSNCIQIQFTKSQTIRLTSANFNSAKYRTQNQILELIIHTSCASKDDSELWCMILCWAERASMAEAQTLKELVPVCQVSLPGPCAGDLSVRFAPCRHTHTHKKVT